jgi:hypothetical protein
VDRIEEVLRLEEIRDAVERLVVDQQRAEKRLFDLDVVRDEAVGRLVVPGGNEMCEGHR